MKKLTFLVFLIPFLSFSQIQYSAYLKEYNDSLRAELKKYEDNSLAIQDSLLNKEIDEILKSVIFGNSNFTTNASSFSFQQDEEKTSITASINHPLSNNSGKVQFFLKSGLFAKGKDNLFNLYSEDSWQNEIGGNLGLILKVSGSKFYDGGTKLDLLKKRRKFYADSLFYSKRPDFQSKYSTLNTNKILMDSILNWREAGLSYDSIKSKVSEDQKKLITRIETKGSLYVRDSIVNELEKLKFFKNFEELDQIQSDKKFLEQIDSWLDQELTFEDIIKTKITSKKDSLFVRELMKGYNEEKGNSKEIVKNELQEKKEWIKRRSKKLQSFLEDELYLFDKINNPTYGYTLGWFDFNLGVSNATYNLSNDSIINSDKLKSLDLEKFDSRIKVIMDLNYNWTWETEKTLGYFQLGPKVTIGNFLDSNLINEPPVFSEINNEYFVLDADGNIIGNYSNLDQTYSFFSPHIYVSCFFLGKKKLGLDFSYEYNLPGVTPNNLDYIENKTIKLGLLFRNLNEKKISNATFGLEVGFENVPDDNYNDFFFTRLKIGVPFNVFHKEK